MVPGVTLGIFHRECLGVLIASGPLFLSPTSQSVLCRLDFAIVYESASFGMVNVRELREQNRVQCFCQRSTGVTRASSSKPVTKMGLR